MTTRWISCFVLGGFFFVRDFTMRRTGQKMIVSTAIENVMNRIKNEDINANPAPGPM
jgi:hypothetical protein